MSLKAYRCSECAFEFVVVVLNKPQLLTTNPCCPECGSDEYTGVIDCLDFNLTEKVQQYEIEKSLKPIPGLTPKPITRKLPTELEEALKLIDPKWHPTFLNFIETGDAGVGFMSMIEHDPKFQKAVEMAFDYRSKGMANFAKALSKKEKP